MEGPRWTGRSSVAAGSSLPAVVKVGRVRERVE